VNTATAAQRHVHRGQPTSGLSTQEDRSGRLPISGAVLVPRGSAQDRGSRSIPSAPRAWTTPDTLTSRTNPAVGYQAVGWHEEARRLLSGGGLV